MGYLFLYVGMTYKTVEAVIDYKNFYYHWLLFVYRQNDNQRSNESTATKFCAQFPFKMADKTMPISVPSEKPLKVIKWKVKEGIFVSCGQILFLYSDSSGNKSEVKKFKALRSGTIVSIKVKEGDIVEPG